MKPSHQLEKASVIDVLDYDCARQFLKDTIAHKREKHSYFGIRHLARRAQIPSPSLLSLILSGRRSLTEKAAVKIAEALQLKGRRRSYFILLGQLTTVKSEQEKKLIHDRLMRIRSAVDSTLLEVKQYRFLADWYYAVIYVMIGQDHFQNDPDWISQKLKNAIEPTVVQQVLKDLENLGLIRLEGDRWLQAHAAISTSDELKNSALFLYHSQMLQKAKEALQLDPGSREFNGVTVSIPQSQLPEVKRRLRDFRKKLNEYLSQFTEPAEVYQINLHLFPLTEGLEQK
jgi:uncharacterized protein (TIGR02147 family)